MFTSSWYFVTYVGKMQTIFTTLSPRQNWSKFPGGAQTCARLAELDRGRASPLSTADAPRAGRLDVTQLILAGENCVELEF